MNCRALTLVAGTSTGLVRQCPADTRLAEEDKIMQGEWARLGQG
jgi:hypothetical protein